ncbi:MAG: response regulator transcription factor [Bacteroidales bacterium]|nr:response regulator transcription factor [Bacteroidales bacterium]
MMKILIADDHAIVREGIKQILKSMKEITLIDEASEGHEAMEKIIKIGYDLVILDISMPGLNGLDILQKMKDKKIESRVLVLSLHPQEQYAMRTFKLGASGYLSKNSAFEELNNAIRRIAAGGKYVSEELAEKILFSKFEEKNEQPHESLSEREFQVMLLLAAGKPVKEIGAELFISDKTVSTYRSRIFNKMGMAKNADLTLYAIKNNLIQ